MPVPTTFSSVACFTAANASDDPAGSDASGAAGASFVVAAAADGPVVVSPVDSTCEADDAVADVVVVVAVAVGAVDCIAAKVVAVATHARSLHSAHHHSDQHQQQQGLHHRCWVAAGTGIEPEMNLHLFRDAVEGCSRAGQFSFEVLR